MKWVIIGSCMRIGIGEEYLLIQLVYSCLSMFGSSNVRSLDLFGSSSSYAPFPFQPGDPCLEVLNEIRI